MKFMVVPHLREHLHTSGDIPRSYEQMVEHCKEYLPNVDTETYFSHLENKDLWAIDDLQDQEFKQEVLQFLEHNPDDSVTQLTLDAVIRGLPACRESKTTKKHRAMKVRAIL